MLDTLIENIYLRMSMKYGSRKGMQPRLKGPKLRVHRNGSVEVSVRDMLNSEAGRHSFMEAHNSPFTQQWLEEHGYEPEIIESWEDI